MARKLYLFALLAPLSLVATIPAIFLYYLYIALHEGGFFLEALTAMLLSSPIPLLVGYFGWKRFMAVRNSSLQITARDNFFGRLFFYLGLWMMVVATFTVFFSLCFAAYLQIVGAHTPLFSIALGFSAHVFVVGFISNEAARSKTNPVSG